MGHENNNATELSGIIEGIRMAMNLNFLPLIAEGDSQIILSLATRLQNGAHKEKITPSWRMESGISQLDEILKKSKAITFHHVRRKANSDG